ncbi:MAG: preprotein translocase subunit YajC [Halanaerobium sp. 4-GBenrich]|jgi:preprotein translocase subunit YajC|uniref:Preprotein translocase subunit YajC n=1 Tax=Halanaerobium congolense TaxID=54121 RepID=A0A1G9QIW7_9FIRM|nr:preprotein translocase subunit YajC [Halanaerobium congolense]ODS50242.1 MAG: preprotein translocase subunit YajC [Halanaerobium sp. 4-GBenrich]TDP11078.1 preprotein translocase subunit YajC [Halanaerobium congolense]TDS31152.1 preprotein translocase subunit YajC [Halanaerobium congolense]SDI82638.1 preprotein translocase subunit YajC [Halanaerobium congolense]SDK48647.1 preprotein translocase subunit YajC [Halanaerobium congolense]
MEYLYAILPWVLIFGIFWFFLIRPQQKQKKEHQNMLDNLAIGDKIVTIGGIKGKIIKINDNNIRIRVSSNVDIDFIKNAISRVEEKNSGKKEEITEKNENDK